MAPLALQGVSERMLKVKCLTDLNFYKQISFPSCFRSETRGKFMPYSIQVHHKYPEASLEAGVSDVLSGSERLFETPNWRFSL